MIVYISNEYLLFLSCNLSTFYFQVAEVLEKEDLKYKIILI